MTTTWWCTASFVTANAGPVTATPPSAVAVSRPLKKVPAAAVPGSTETVVRAVPPAGTVTVSGDTVNSPAGAGAPDRSGAVGVTVSTTSAVPALWYVTVRVTGVAASGSAKYTPVSSAVAHTFWETARATSRRPAPCS
ncbi:hypothetical protein [Streptomyces sp. NPDC001292]|uniref:hypothetical protein n=1 Tax=Streptomyces sp. NPDC001292 TaxID=3364558 RepID=UPI00369D8148